MRTPGPPAPGRGRVAAGLLMALACGAGVLALHAAFVLTGQGQRVDEATRRGAQVWEDHLSGSLASAVDDVLDGALDAVSAVSVLLVVVAVAAVGLARRRVGVAVAAVVLVAGSTVTTQVLKRWVLPRPELIDLWYTGNTLPSGHTTFAAAAAAAVLLVAPPRLRPTAAVTGAAYTTVTGVATLAADWHRASDVVAAVLVVGAWAGLVTAALATTPRDGDGQEGGHALVTTALVLGALAGAVGAALVLGRAWAVELPTRDRLELALVAVGGGLAIGSSSCGVQAGVLALRRRRRAGPVR